MKRIIQLWLDELWPLALVVAVLMGIALMMMVGAAAFCPDPLTLCDAYQTPDRWSVQENFIPCIEGCLDTWWECLDVWTDADIGDCVACCITP